MTARIFTSSKYQAAWVVTVLASVTLGFSLTDDAAGRPAKQAAVERYVLTVAAAWGVSTAGTALEDYAKHRDAPASGGRPPHVQVNTGQAATNVQVPAGGGAEAPPSPPTRTVAAAPQTNASASHAKA